MNKTLFQTLLFLTIFLSSCGSKLDVPDGYILTEEALKENLQQHDTNLVFFWTDWCGASKHRIETVYKPLVKQLKKDSLDVQLILLAADQNVTLEQIDELRGLGFNCFYIDRPGNHPFVNRRAIKSYINSAFPNNEVKRTGGGQYALPVELLITSDLEIVNAVTYSKSAAFIEAIRKENEQE